MRDICLRLDDLVHEPLVGRHQKPVARHAAQGVRRVGPRGICGNDAGVAASSPPFVADFDSATGFVRALAAALHDRPFRDLGP